jgi:hypothetical protein
MLFLVKFAKTECKTLQLFKKVSDVRRVMLDERRRTSTVRWSESSERNEADEPFSTACRRLDLHGTYA